MPEYERLKAAIAGLSLGQEQVGRQFDAQFDEQTVQEELTRQLQAITKELAGVLKQAVDQSQQPDEQPVVKPSPSKPPSRTAANLDLGQIKRQGKIRKLAALLKGYERGVTTQSQVVDWFKSEDVGSREEAIELLGTGEA